ncbi:response regulator [Ramlibacter sp.]|uniref:response regulator n=1 Tax=Ramlibacter sp. TaxID=1917967 RepID=UPI003D096969
MQKIQAQKVRVILADDHMLTRAGFRALLEQLPSVEVVAEAGSGDELVRVAQALEPDIVFTDLEMPRLDGIGAIRELSNSCPGVRAVVVSAHNTADMVKRAAAAGAAGYVMKDASSQEFGNAIQSILERGTYWSPGVAALLLSKTEPSPTDVLTERQIEIVKRLASGESAKEIAYALNLSTKTVDAHRARIMERLRMNDIATLTRYALKHQLIAP